MTARLLLKRKHEVIIIEKNREFIDSLTETMDCGFLYGDGSKPAILKEVDPAHSDSLFCLTGDDKTNILASLVGRSLGFQNVITKIDDPELEHVCLELGLEDTIIPARTIGRYLADMLEGKDPMELSTMIREEARTFSFVLPAEFSGTANDLNLPKNSRIICLYRDNRFIIPEDDFKFKNDDEIVIITHSDNLPDLKAYWQV